MLFDVQFFIHHEEYSFFGVEARHCVDARNKCLKELRERTGMKLELLKKVRWSAQQVA